MNKLNKVIRVGTIPVGRTHASLFCKIKIEDGNLSISGVIGPTRGGNAIGGCGQVDMEFKHRNPAHDDKRYSNLIPARAFNFADGWNSRLWLRFLEVWHDWHLNDMRSACEHQRALGWTYATHPSAPCPTCGYKLGSAWMKEELPTEVIEFLSALPDTDRQPAWI